MDSHLDSTSTKWFYLCKKMGEREKAHEICLETNLAEIPSLQARKSPISKKALLIVLKVRKSEHEPCA